MSRIILSTSFIVTHLIFIPILQMKKPREISFVLDHIAKKR